MDQRMITCKEDMADLMDELREALTPVFQHFGVAAITMVSIPAAQMFYDDITRINIAPEVKINMLTTGVHAGVLLHAASASGCIRDKPDRSSPTDARFQIHTSARSYNGCEADKERAILVTAAEIKGLLNCMKEAFIKLTNLQKALPVCATAEIDSDPLIELLKEYMKRQKNQ